MQFRTKLARSESSSGESGREAIWLAAILRAPSSILLIWRFHRNCEWLLVNLWIKMVRKKSAPLINIMSSEVWSLSVIISFIHNRCSLLLFLAIAIPAVLHWLHDYFIYLFE